MVEVARSVCSTGTHTVGAIGDLTDITCFRSKKNVSSACCLKLKATPSFARKE
jgi:hypothetical protein